VRFVIRAFVIDSSFEHSRPLNNPLVPSRRSR
jgi:hypothetical protein